MGRQGRRDEAKMINLRAVVSRFMILTVGRSLRPSRAEMAEFSAQERTRERDQQAAKQRHLETLMPEIAQFTADLTRDWPAWRSSKDFLPNIDSRTVVKVYHLHVWAMARQQFPRIADNDGVLRAIVQSVLSMNKAYPEDEILQSVAAL